MVETVRTYQTLRMSPGLFQLFGIASRPYNDSAFASSNA